MGDYSVGNVPKGQENKGLYVTLVQEPNQLSIKLTEEGKEFLQGESQIEAGEVHWKKAYSEILWALLQDFIEVGDLEIFSDQDLADVGALTSAPVIGFGVSRDDDSRLTDVEDVYWFPNYQVESELDTLLQDGEVVFDKSEKCGE